METFQKELQAKIDRIHAARMQVEKYAADGGNLKAKEAVPIGLELARSCKDLCQEFAQEVLDEMNGATSAAKGDPDPDTIAMVQRLDGKSGEKPAADNAESVPGVD